MIDERLISYIREHIDYPAEAVAEVLLEAGYTPKDIADAEKQLHMQHGVHVGRPGNEPSEVARQPRMKRLLKPFAAMSALAQRVPRRVWTGIVIVLVASTAAYGGFWFGARDEAKMPPIIIDPVVMQDDPTQSDSETPAVFTGALAMYESCSAVFGAFKDFRIAQRSAYEIPGVLEQKLARWEYGGFGGGGASESISDYSRTNVQVEGVDEPDVVKTDGDYLYILGSRDFHKANYTYGYGASSVSIVQAYPPDAAKKVGTIVIEAKKNAEDLLLFGDILLVIGSRYSDDGELSEDRGTITWIEYYNIFDRENPKYLRTVEFEGSLVGARSIGDYAYFAISTSRRSAEDEDMPDAFLPVFRDTLGASEVPPFSASAACEGIAKVEPVTSTSFLTLAVIPLADPAAAVTTDTIAGAGDDVYASHQNFYIASSHLTYSMPSDLRLVGFPVFQRQDTIINKFSLSGGSVVHVAQGFAPGTVLDQFSMDEHEGMFRIATTVVPGALREGEPTNGVYVFDEGLEMVGRLDGLAPGERIYSARFYGDRAYLVTFKKVDPFFVIDLEEPQSPKVLGALKIPGFSDYLHPFNKEGTMVIGIGKNTIAASNELIEERGIEFAWFQGVKIALFDATDPANPKELYKVDIGDRGTDSPVLHDHKAFLFDASRNLLVLPIMLAELDENAKARDPLYAGSEYGKTTFQGAYVYQLTAEDGFTFLERITHLPEGYEGSSNFYFSRNDVFIYRNVRIGDYLYVISNSRISVHNLSDYALVADVRLFDE